MFEFSLIRVLGVSLSLAILVLLFLSLRRQRQNRPPFFLGLFVGVGLLVVSAAPALLNVPATALNMDNQPLGRLVLLTVLSNLVAWLVILYLVSSLNNSHRLRVQQSEFLVQLTINGSQDTQHFAQVTDKVLVIIPALNEEENLPTVLSRIDTLKNREDLAILVVDDGSDDGTSQVAMAGGALVVKHPIRRGGGAALRTGYSVAQKWRAKAVVTMDADGQHDPDEIADVIAPILSDEADMTIGSRILGSMEMYSRLRNTGVHLFSGMLSFALGQKISDCASGFRGFSLQALTKFELLEDQYHTAETIIAAKKAGLRIKEVPIHIAARMHGETKKGKSMAYALAFLRAFVGGFVQH